MHEMVKIVVTIGASCKESVPQGMGSWEEAVEMKLLFYRYNTKVMKMIRPWIPVMAYLTFSLIEVRTFFRKELIKYNPFISHFSPTVQTGKILL